MKYFIHICRIFFHSLQMYIKFAKFSSNIKKRNRFLSQFYFKKNVEILNPNSKSCNRIH